jgi:hypothetical protein
MSERYGRLKTVSKKNVASALKEHEIIAGGKRT